MGYGKISKEEAERRNRLFQCGIIVCGHCKRELPLSMFTKEKNKKNGHSSLCKDCQKEQRERRKGKIAEWFEANKEKVKAQRREYSKTHAEQKRKYNQSNKEYFKQKRKEYESMNLEKVQKQRRKQRRKLSTKYKKYKSEAEKRNVLFDLAYEEFEAIITQPCHYCKSLPEDEFGNKYTGIDRVDSSQGYTITNCVPCCDMCNWMKLDHSLEHWTSKMSQILSHLESIGYITPSPNNPDELQFNDAIFEQLTNKIQKG